MTQHSYNPKQKNGKCLYSLASIGNAVHPLSVVKKLALVGCGAVTQQYYVPALKQVPECTVGWFVDTNLSNAKRAAACYGSGNATTDYVPIIDKVDAAIIAVPNDLHSVISVDFLKAGRRVLCEKPIANSSENAMEMIRASERSGARLSINLPRRRYESYRILRHLLKSSFNGVTRIDYQEGAPLSWAFSSSYSLRKERSGGGVLIDWGVHSMDLLSWLFGDKWELISYRDDGLGQIESNCVVDFIIEWHQTRVPCHMELSYARRLGGQMIIAGDWGQLQVDLHQTNEIRLRTETENLTITSGHSLRSYVSCFAEQVRSFIGDTLDDSLAGEDALHTLRFIEKCYGKRQNLSHSWDESNGSPPTSSPKRILIVGASGFLGTRLAERMTLDFGLKVRGTYHRPERAIRLARLPLELVECNVLDRDQVMQAMKGCDVVVNCSIGTSGNAEMDMKVYRCGTRNLLDAAKIHAVRKFIHISTAAVHSFRQSTRLANESCPLKSRTSRSLYEQGKVSQEKLVREYAESVPTTILRPTLIYGPYSKDWVVNITDRLLQGKPTLVENGGLANLVYVDDVIDAILLAVEKEEATGKTLILNNDEETVSWAEYVSIFAGLTHATANVLSGDLRVERLRALVRLCTDSVLACWNNLRSREMLMLAARIPLAVVLGSKIVRGAKRKRMEEALVLTDKPPSLNMQMRLAKYETMSRNLYENLTCRTVFSSSLAKSSLGWKPRTSFVEGSRRSLQWAKWAGLGLQDVQSAT